MTDTPAPDPSEAHPSAAAAGSSRAMLRAALKGYLATIDQRSGHPYASLVTVATDCDGTPVFLISRLALHTQNIESDPRASLVVDETGVAGDPLAGGRVTFIGKVAPTASASARRRFLARHPAAELYAGFADFGFFRLEIEAAHYIGGFGRIVDLRAGDVCIDVTGAAPLAAAENDILSHMNSDHADAVALYARWLAGAPDDGPWRMAGIDPEGFDLIGPAGGRRVVFPVPIATPGDARRVLVELAEKARMLAAAGGASAGGN